MPIRLICVCGRGMLLPEKYASQHVQCPDCGAMLRIPSWEEDLGLTRWFCTCGLRLKARPQAAGRKVKCPRCGNAVTVPLLEKEPSFLNEEYTLDGDSGIVTVTAREVSAKEVVQAEGTPTRQDEGELDLEPDEIPLAAEAAEPSGEAEEVYEAAEEAVSAPSAPRPEPVRAALARPMPSTPPPRVEDEDDEGIRAGELSSYFNAQSGLDAARSGVMQVLHGHWLFIPYILLAGCLENLTQLVLTRTMGHEGTALLIGLGVVDAFLLAGFLGCIKDGVFERAMGIERLLYHGAVNFLNVLGTTIIMAPVFVAALLGLTYALFGCLAEPPGFFSTIIRMTIFLTGLVFLFQICLIPVEVAVVERRNPITSLIRAVRFAVRHAGQVLSLTWVSASYAITVVFIFYCFWWLLSLILFLMLPPWAWVAASSFIVSLVFTSIFGQMVASFMVLYLSGLEEERLQQIKSRLRGPGASPMLLYAAIIALAGGFLGLYYYNPYDISKAISGLFGR